MTKITNMQFEHIGKSLLSQHHRLEAQASSVDYDSDPKKHHALGLLALKVLEAWESMIECTDEYEFLDIKLFMEGEA